MKGHRVFLNELNLAFQPFIGSYETTTFRQCLETGIMWMGEIMQAKGVESPYAKKDGNRKTVDDISETADMPKEVTVYLGNNAIEAIEQSREELQKVIESLEKAYVEELNPGLYQGVDFVRISTSYHATLINLTSAKMWLGKELARIKQST